MTLLSQWFDVWQKFREHNYNARRAEEARNLHMSDRVRGIYRVVDANLERVSRRETHAARKAVESLEVKK